MVVVKGMTVNKFECLKKIWINKKILGPYKIQRTVLTNPCLSLMLLVSLSLWNETTFCIHCSPVDGESGWIYIRFGISGSALPATIHRLETNTEERTKILKKVIKSKCRRECENVKISCIQKMVTLLISLPIVKFIAVIVGCNNV